MVVKTTAVDAVRGESVTWEHISTVVETGRCSRRRVVKVRLGTVWVLEGRQH